MPQEACGNCLPGLARAEGTLAEVGGTPLNKPDSSPVSLIVLSCLSDHISFGYNNSPK